MDYIALGQRIRMRREELNLTQTSVAEAIHVTSSFIGHIERGTRKASMDTLVKLAIFFHVGTDALLMDSLADALLPRTLTKEERRLALHLIDVVRMYYDFQE